MATEWAERVRRTRPWRLVIRGLQGWLAGAAVIGAAIGLGAVGVPKLIVTPLALTGFGVAFLSFPFAFVGMLLSMAQNYQQFSAHAYDLKAIPILWRDLFRWRPPAPFVERAWPPPQWRPHQATDQPIETRGADSGESASGG